MSSNFIETASNNTVSSNPTETTSSASNNFAAAASDEKDLSSDSTSPDFFQTLRDVYLNEDVHSLIARELYQVNVTRDGSIGMYLLTATPVQDPNDDKKDDDTKDELDTLDDVRILAVFPTRLKLWLHDDHHRGQQEVDELLDNNTRPRDLRPDERMLVGACLGSIFRGLGPNASKGDMMYFKGLPTDVGVHMMVLLRPYKSSSPHIPNLMMENKIPEGVFRAPTVDHKLELIRHLRDTVTHVKLFNQVWNNC